VMHLGMPHFSNIIDKRKKNKGGARRKQAYHGGEATSFPESTRWSLRSSFSRAKGANL
jgi:hypothetical protein